MRPRGKWASRAKDTLVSHASSAGRICDPEIFLRGKDVRALKDIREVPRNATVGATESGSYNRESAARMIFRKLGQPSPLDQRSCGGRRAMQMDSFSGQLAEECGAAFRQRKRIPICIGGGQLQTCK